MARKKGRVQNCGLPQARVRLNHARAHLEVAELAADTKDSELEYSSVAASIAILAGIAAADAACCAALGQRSRSDNHLDASNLLTQITPGGKAAATKMRQLIALKDSAHYGLISVSTAQLKQSMRHAGKLVVFAEGVLLRST